MINKDVDFRPNLRELVIQISGDSHLLVAIYALIGRLFLYSERSAPSPVLERGLREERDQDVILSYDWMIGDKTQESAETLSGMVVWDKLRRSEKITLTAVVPGSIRQLGETSVHVQDRYAIHQSRCIRLGAVQVSTCAFLVDNTRYLRREGRSLNGYRRTRISHKMTNSEYRLGS